MVTKNVCMAYIQKNQPYNTSLANHTIHVFVIPFIITTCIIINQGCSISNNITSFI